MTAPTAPTMSLKNDLKQDNQKKRQSDIKAFLVETSKNAAGKEPEKMDLLGTKATVTSKTDAAAKKDHKEEPEGYNKASCCNNQTKHC